MPISKIIVLLSVVQLFSCNDAGKNLQPINVQLTKTKNSSNIIYNGKFEKGTDGWSIYTGSGAVADISVVNETLLVNISNGGNTVSQLNVNQTGLTFEKGKAYQVTFEAKADSPRKIYCKAGMTHEPWVPLYSQFQDFEITTVVFVFTNI